MGSKVVIELTSERLVEMFDGEVAENMCRKLFTLFKFQKQAGLSRATLKISYCYAVNLQLMKTEPFLKKDF